MRYVIPSCLLFFALTAVASTNILLNDERPKADLIHVSPATELELRPTRQPVTEEAIALALAPLVTPSPVEKDISVAKDLLNDGTYVWKWGAWRDPVTDKAYEPPQPQPYTTAAPQYTQSSQPTASASTNTGGGSLSLQCGRNYPPDVEKWASVAAQYSWDICEWANIVDCESDGMEWIANPYSGACGVMQHLPCQYLGDGAGSIALGFEKYAARGWQPWTVGGCYPY